MQRLRTGIEPWSPFLTANEAMNLSSVGKDQITSEQSKRDDTLLNGEICPSTETGQRLKSSSAEEISKSLRKTFNSKVRRSIREKHRSNTTDENSLASRWIQRREEKEREIFTHTNICSFLGRIS